MPTVRDILSIKGPKVRTVGPSITVLEAAQVMNEDKIGSLVVMDDDRLVGVFTERDVLQRIVVPCRDPAKTQVGEVMTTELVCCRPHTKLEEARAVMKNRRIRHLPVIDDEERLCGMISIGDLNAQLANEQESTIHVLEQYIYGRV